MSGPFRKDAFVIAAALAIFLLAGCAGSENQIFKSRDETLPQDIAKMHPEDDIYPPILHSALYEEPVPVPGLVNTNGGEDSAFVTPDGNTLYFFFTPDVRIPAELQVIDGTTGIYISEKDGGSWGDARRIILQDKDKLSLDGCEFVQGNKMWFCTVREGNFREIDIWTAEYDGKEWSRWKNAGKHFNEDVGVGEMHISSDATELYFHSGDLGGKGGYDIWVSKKVDGGWGQAQNVEAVNSPDSEGWPFITEDMQELWFTRFYLGSPAVFVSRKKDGEWSAPELMISQFAGEPSLDGDGNIYFTHHFYNDSAMIEADIYVAFRK